MSKERYTLDDTVPVDVAPKRYTLDDTVPVDYAMGEEWHGTPITSPGRAGLSEMALEPDEPMVERQEYSHLLGEGRAVGMRPMTRPIRSLAPGSEARQRFEAGEREVPPPEKPDLEMQTRALHEGMTYGAGVFGEKAKRILKGEWITPPMSEAEEAAMQEHLGLHGTATELAGTLFNPLFLGMGKVAGVVGPTMKGVQKTMQARKMDVIPALKLIKETWQTDPAGFGKVFREFLAAGGRTVLLAQSMAALEEAESGSSEDAERVFNTVLAFGAALEGLVGSVRLGTGTAAAIKSFISDRNPFVKRAARHADEISEYVGKLKGVGGEDIPTEKTSELLGAQDLAVASRLGQERKVLEDVALTTRDHVIARKRLRGQEVARQGERRAEAVERRAEAGAEQTMAGTERAIGRRVRDIKRAGEAKAGEVSERFNAAVEKLEAETSRIIGEVGEQTGRSGAARVISARKNYSKTMNSFKDEFGKIQQGHIDANADALVNPQKVVDLVDEVMSRTGISPEVKALAEKVRGLFSSKEIVVGKGARAEWAKFLKEGGKMPSAGEVTAMPLPEFIAASRSVPYAPGLPGRIRHVVAEVLEAAAKVNPTLKPLAALHRDYNTAMNQAEVLRRSIQPGKKGAATRGTLKAFGDSEVRGELALAKDRGAAAGERVQRGFAPKLEAVAASLTQAAERRTKNIEAGKRAVDVSKLKKAEQEALEGIKLATDTAAERMKARGEVAKRKLGVKAEQDIQQAKEKAARMRERVSQAVGQEERRLTVAVRDMHRRDQAGIQAQYQGVPDSVEGWMKLLLKGQWSDVEQSGLLEFAKKEVGGKPNPIYRPEIERLLIRAANIRMASEIGSLWGALVGKPLAAGISFGPTVTAKRTIRALFGPEVQGAVVLQSKWVRDLVNGMQRMKVHESPMFMQAMKGIWPLGLPARLAMPVIIKDHEKRAAFVEAMDELAKKEE